MVMTFSLRCEIQRCPARPDACVDRLDASASFLKCSSMRGQPPSTSLRMEAPASAPSRSNLQCSNSTRVASVPCAMNLTSTSELTVVSGFHLLLRSQLITKRCGGSHTSTLPTSACEPSSLNSYQRPPRRGSNTAVCIGGLPMVWVRGHQRPKPDVNTSNACA